MIRIINNRVGGKLTLDVYNVNGGLVLKKTISELQSEFSIADFASGLYVLVFTNEKGNIQSEKLIVE